MLQDMCQNTSKLNIGFPVVKTQGTLHVRHGVLRQPVTARSSYECELVDAYYSDLARVVTMHRREVLNCRHDCGAERELQEHPDRLSTKRNRAMDYKFTNTKMDPHHRSNVYLVAYLRFITRTTSHVHKNVGRSKTHAPVKKNHVTPQAMHTKMSTKARHMLQ